MKKQVYQAPVVEVIEVRVEKGFAGSGCNNTPQYGQIETFGYVDDIHFN